MSRIRTSLRVAWTVAVLALLCACATAPPRLPPPPVLPGQEAVIPGMPGARYWGDAPPSGFDRWLALPDAELAAAYGDIMRRPHHYLALSGGGSDGAYGAGILAGWTAHGTRPEFTIVTGISTGALIAPFAFLGSKYDATLRNLYTSSSTASVAEARGLLDILRNDAAANSGPLKRLIEQNIDENVVRELAVEHRRGRSLLVGTTNLDVARPVTWNLTRIAASGSPDALKLIRDVVLASASIPGIFPPVMIEVEVAGARYEEMHVDGGVTSQVFVYPAGLDWAKVRQRLGVQGAPSLYVIDNARVMLLPEAVERRIVPILMRSVDSLIRTQGIGNLAEIYYLARRDDVAFNLAFIPATFAEQPTEKFDPVYMRKLYELGFDNARRGYPWTTGPMPARQAMRERPRDNAP